MQDRMTAEALLVHAARLGGQPQGARWACCTRRRRRGLARWPLWEAHRHIVVQFARVGHLDQSRLVHLILRLQHTAARDSCGLCVRLHQHQTAGLLQSDAEV